MHCVYILFSPSLTKFYTGETSNLEIRLAQHKSGFYVTAYSTLASDWELFLSIDCQNILEARFIEKHVKAMKSSNYIRNLKQYPEMVMKIKTKHSELRLKM